MAQEFSSSEIEDIVKSWMKETPEASDQEASEFFSIFGDKAIEVYNNSFPNETNPSGKTKGSWVPDIATAKKEEDKFNGKAKRYGHVLTIKNPDKNSWPQGITTKTGYIRTLGFDMTTQW